MSTFTPIPALTASYNHSTIDDNSGMTAFTSVVMGVVTHHSITADRGTCEITCSSYPAGLAENDHVVITIGGTTVFNGRLARPAVQYYDHWSFYCEDIGANLAFLWGGEGTDPELDALKNRVYSNTTDDALIVNLFEAMGGPVSLHSIPTTLNPLATIFDITLRVGQAPWSLIRGEQGIDIIFGCWTATTNDGVLRRGALAYAGTPDFTATEGTNILQGSNRQPLGTESIINRYVVFGYDNEFGTIGGVGVGDYSVANGNIPTPPTSHTAIIRNSLIESNAQALATATLQVGLHNFPYDETNLILLGNASITIGKTVRIDSADLDHDGTSAADRFVAECSHRWGLGGYDVAIKCIRVA